MTSDNGHSRHLKKSGITDVLRIGARSRMSSFVIISGNEKPPQNWGTILIYGQRNGWSRYDNG